MRYCKEAQQGAALQYGDCCFHSSGRNVEEVERLQTIDERAFQNTKLLPGMLLQFLGSIFKSL